MQWRSIPPATSIWRASLVLSTYPTTPGAYQATFPYKLVLLPAPDISKDQTST